MPSSYKVSQFIYFFINLHVYSLRSRVMCTGVFMLILYVYNLQVYFNYYLRHRGGAAFPKGEAMLRTQPHIISHIVNISYILVISVTVTNMA